MSDCRHRQDQARLEFSRVDGTKVVEVFGCPVHAECTLVEEGVVARELRLEFDVTACRHRGDMVRTIEGASCCSDGGDVAIFSCSLFTECTERFPVPNVRGICGFCSRHTDRETRVMVCERCVDRQE